VSGFNQLQAEIHALANMFASPKDLSVINLKTLLTELDNINRAESRYYSNGISGEELAELITRSQANIRSFAAGGVLTSPELILAGDAGINNPEFILTLPMLQRIIEETSGLTTKVIANKLDELIERIDEFEGRIHILESDVGKAANNYNYKQRRRSVIR
jgi:hypothetical protein